MMMMLIALSVALSIAVNLQERAFREGSAKAADRFDIVIGGLGSEVQLVLSTVYLQSAVLPLIPTSVLTELQQNPQVEWAAPLAFGDFVRGMPIVGTNKMFISHKQREKMAGRVFENAFEAVVGSKTGFKLGDKFSPLHGQLGEAGTHSHQNVAYEVVGILPPEDSIWDTAVLVPLETIWETHAHSGQSNLQAVNNKNPITGKVQLTRINQLNDIHEHPELGISAIVVKPKSFAAAYKLRGEYRNGKTQALFPAEVLVRVYAILGDSKEVLKWIATVSQILVAIALIMIVTLYLKQQQRQIAAWRIFGAPRYKILWLIWATLLMMIIAAIVLGVAIGYFSTVIISQKISLKSGFALPVSLNLEDVYYIASIFIIALLMALIPSLLFYKQSPLKGLKEDR